MGIQGEGSAAEGEVVKLLEPGKERGERYWCYGFGLDGSLAQDVLVGRKRFLEPSWTRVYGRFNSILVGDEGRIGDGFLVAQKHGEAVWVALGYLGWDRQLVIGSSALNEVISGFNPPKNQLVLYRRDIVWLKGLRDKKTLVARAVGFGAELRIRRQDQERDEAINASMLAKKRYLTERRERYRPLQKKTLANLQAICTTLELERHLEPLWGWKFTEKIGSLEKRLSALEAKGQVWRMPTKEEMKKLPWPAQVLLERLANES